MKKVIIISLLTVVFGSSFAQGYHPDYEDTYLGWIKMYHFKGATKPLQVDEKNYSLAQLSIVDSIANWMQASYVPKGGLGDIIKYVTPKKGLYAERYNEAIPQSYGARAVTYLFLKKQNGKWVPENNLGITWSVCANEIPMYMRLMELNTSKICLFTIDGYDEDLIKTQPNSDEAKQQKLYDLSTHPVLKKYIQYNVPGGANRSNLVVLSKNNRPPFINVTIGEALQYAEEAIPVKQAEEKQVAQEKSTARDGDFFVNQVIEKFEKVKKTIDNLRKKYKNRLNEFAYTSYGGPSMTGLANGQDIFAISDMNGKERFDKRFPILRIDPELKERCKTDQPQWILIKWQGGALDQVVYKHMHESIIHNVDFDYVYQFFFEPEKVKGRPYKPLRSPIVEEKPVLMEKSETTKKAETDASVWFFDDFSTTVAGQKPMDWKSEMNAEAKPATVVNVQAQPAKWLEIKGNYFVVPEHLRKPLPQNFELSFDLAVPKDIPWGAKALELLLCTQNKLNENDGFIKIRFRAGFYGRPGEITLQTQFGSAYASNKTDYAGIGFSNDKVFNAIKVRLIKKAEQLQLYFDNNKIAELKQGLPASTLFNWLQFKHLNSSNDTEKYLVTNVKINRL
ncbi:MAG: hypothetical protein U0Y10_26185 [Spirosomataceae bacterium]